MKKIRLLQVIPNLNSGGAERGTVDIANAIVKSDNISFVVSNGGRLERNLKLNKTNFIKLPVHSKNPWIIYRNINKIQNIVKKNNINIIHTRSRAPAWSTYYVAKKNKTKSVSTFHNIYGNQNLNLNGNYHIITVEVPNGIVQSLGNIANSSYTFHCF